MDNENYDHEMRQVARQLPIGPRVAVIGSASFWGSDSGEICCSVGTHLASLKDLLLLTGGVPAVGEAVGRAFVAERRRLSYEENTYHILPHGSEGWDYGVTLFAGASMLERREILGRLSRIYLVIEGGPGTVHEARVAQARGAVVVPVGRTGGFAEDLYSQCRCPRPGIDAEWKLLGDSSASTVQVGKAVYGIVGAVLNGDS